MTPWTVVCVHGILQAIILQWVSIPFSRGSYQPRDQTQGWNLGIKPRSSALQADFLLSEPLVLWGQRLYSVVGQDCSFGFLPKLATGWNQKLSSFSSLEGLEAIFNSWVGHQFIYFFPLPRLGSQNRFHGQQSLYQLNFLARCGYGLSSTDGQSLWLRSLLHCSFREEYGWPRYECWLL